MIYKFPKFLAFLMAAILFISACSTHSEPVSRAPAQIELIEKSESNAAAETRVRPIDFGDDVTTVPEELLGGVAFVGVAVGLAGMCAMVGVLPCLL